METIRERTIFYEDNYTPLFFAIILKGDKEILIGMEDKCRFCGKSHAETTFKNKSHAIPLCLGNYVYISRDECDKCNKIFSEGIEDHLDKYTKPFRLIGKIKGRKKIPSYRSKDRRSRFSYNNQNKMAEIVDVIGCEKTEMDFVNKKIKYTFDREPYIPIAVYKALVKIGISLMPDSLLPLFTQSVDWIKDENHNNTLLKPANVMYKFVPGERPNKGVIIQLLHKKSVELEGYPSCFLVMAFGNIILQVMIPSDLDMVDNNVKMTFIAVPTPFDEGWKYGDPEQCILDLTSGELKVNDTFTVSFKADDIIPVDVNSLGEIQK